MASERIRRQFDRLLDDAETAANANDWPLVADKARAVLSIDAGNEDAQAFLTMAEANLGAPATPSTPAPAPPPAAAPAVPESFAAGRYHVRKFLGEGGKKRVFLAHDALLDRDVAFALIKTEGLDATGRERITREAQAMGRMGTHPHVVSIFDIGEEGGAPYVVTELLGGGDVEGLLAAEGGLLPLARTLEIAKGVARGLAFAHQQGVVHRDLKPGNVWLTSEGVAKIGDFGLAVALDRSRLTTHGLMVGTVAYMPPEQALGGEVTPHADLYALGAMLYELVTGKPPFAGDSPTAIISQHISTPPVAPSWHSQHCPPDLEALILKLLAKVPADRPASALEVLEALERVDPEAPSVRHSDSSANPLDRLARGVFVGRERELERLRAAFDETFAGRGSVVMLVGEPGIGKTRTVQEVSTYARMRGAQVLWGRAHESAGAPPYWPWVYVARAYRDQNSEETRRSEWGPYAVELQRIFAGLRSLFPNLPPPPEAESEETQFALFDAMTNFLRSVSTRVPLVIVLDDLHWADRATLQLLAHLARDLADSRILVLGTYRDTDVDRRHPLSQALAQMNREDLFSRIPLRGLTPDEIAAYLGQTAGIAPPTRLVQRIYEETEGNPFFLSQVVALMTQEGTLGATSLSDVAIPEGVREALGRRLDRLSEPANALLTILAVVGRENDFALAKDLSGHADETVLALLEEAIGARVLEETGPTTYRFTHALMVETLLEELSAARRVRLHARIAEALERRYGEAPDMLAQIASHYAEAEPVLGTEKLVHYSMLAGQQALLGAAWNDAEAHFERGLAAYGTTRGDRTVAHLSFGLARARLAQSADAQSVPETWTHLRRAFDIFRASGDAPNAIAVADHDIPVNRPIDGMSEMSGRALQLAASGSRDEARLLSRHGYDVGVMDGQYEAGRAELERARAIAAAKGDAELESKTLARLASLAGNYMRWQECIATARQSQQLAREALTTTNFWFGSLAAMSIGDGETARALVEAMHEAAQRTRMPREHVAAQERGARYALSIGDWAGAKSATEVALSYVPNGAIALLLSAVREAYLGQLEGARPYLQAATVQQPEVPSTGGFAVSYALCALLGAAELGAIRYVQNAIPRMLERTCTPHVEHGGRVALALLAIVENDADAARVQYKYLAPQAGTSFDGWVCIDRVLGLIDAMSGQNESAARWFESAIAFCRRAGYRPELAWASYDLGRTLISADGADRERGQRALDEALAIANDLQMRPLIDKIIATRGMLGA